jgi:hypothetical protein
MLAALNAWCADVRQLHFPTPRQTSTIKDDQFEAFLNTIG